MVIIDILDPLAIETGIAIAAFIVDRPQPWARYNASKAALHQMVKFLAVELAPKNIRVNLPPRRVTS
jgi:NAD(P)-dependent dehydrogenase (short-subunit alcohol dehydrogenase family)